LRIKDSFIFLRVFRLNQRLMVACLLCLMFGGSLYPYAVAAKERLTVEAMAWSVAGKVIVVDPGHGGIDSGAVGSSGILEKGINMEIARRLAALFRQAGATAILTRDGDYELTDRQNKPGFSNRDELQSRLDLADKNNADLYISVHLNSYPSPDCEGAQVFYHPRSVDSHRLASLIQQEMINRLGDNYRWAKAEDFFVLRNLKRPSVVVEAGFLSHPREGALLTDPVYQNKIAWCVYAGAVRFFAGEPAPKSPY
jgi:N-acetylmuramoyl-L-alanine amidase